MSFKKNALNFKDNMEFELRWMAQGGNLGYKRDEFLGYQKAADDPLVDFKDKLWDKNHDHALLFEKGVDSRGRTIMDYSAKDRDRFEQNVADSFKALHGDAEGKADDKKLSQWQVNHRDQYKVEPETEARLVSEQIHNQLSFQLDRKSISDKELSADEAKSLNFARSAIEESTKNLAKALHGGTYDQQADFQHKIGLNFAAEAVANDSMAANYRNLFGDQEKVTENKALTGQLEHRVSEAGDEPGVQYLVEQMQADYNLNGQEVQALEGMLAGDAQYKMPDTAQPDLTVNFGATPEERADYFRGVEAYSKEWQAENFKLIEELEEAGQTDEAENLKYQDTMQRRLVGDLRRKASAMVYKESVGYDTAADEHEYLEMTKSLYFTWDPNNFKLQGAAGDDQAASEQRTLETANTVLQGAVSEPETSAETADRNSPVDAPA